MATTQEPPKLKAAILIVSDTASADATTDKAGPTLQSGFKDFGGGQWDVQDTTIVPDEVSKIEQFIKRWSDFEDAINLIVTSGGTGFAVKDRTPEVSSLHGSRTAR
jgi:gephyrin